MKTSTSLLLCLTLSLVQGQLLPFGELSSVIGIGPSIENKLESLLTTLKLISGEAVNTARAAVSPVLQVSNHTVQEARNTLESLAGEVTMGALRARGAGLKAAQCAQEKQKQAEQLIKEAMGKLDGCAVSAALEARGPMGIIENLTQEAVQLIDNSTGGIADCMARPESVRCLIDLVRSLSREVGVIMDSITKQALGAEKSVAHVTGQVVSCVNGQVKMASKLVLDLDIDSCTKAK